MASRLIEGYCQESGVSIEALRGGGRLGQVRREMAIRLTTEVELSLTETARLLGATSGFSTRKELDCTLQY